MPGVLDFGTCCGVSLIIVPGVCFIYCSVDRDWIMLKEQMGG